MNGFGDIIRKAREEKGLFLRQVAAEMEIDQAISANARLTKYLVIF